MAHELYTRTNQKMYFAGLSLENLRKAEESGSLNAQGTVQAEREASLFHLYGALLGLCHEITGYYRMPGANSPRVEQILNRSMLESSPSPELGELLELAEHRDTWLAALITAYSSLSEPPRAPTKTKTDPGLPLIEAVSIEQEAPALSRDELEVWRQNLKTLALRFRESLTES